MASKKFADAFAEEGKVSKHRGRQCETCVSPYRKDLEEYREEGASVAVLARTWFKLLDPDEKTIYGDPITQETLKQRLTSHFSRGHAGVMSEQV